MLPGIKRRGLGIMEHTGLANLMMGLFLIELVWLAVISHQVSRLSKRIDNMIATRIAMDNTYNKLHSKYPFYSYQYDHKEPIQ